MVDRDWLDTSNPGTSTDESKHPNTRLNFANEFDLNIKGWLLNQPDYQLGLMAGYQKIVIALQQKEALISIVVREASGMKRDHFQMVKEL